MIDLKLLKQLLDVVAVTQNAITEQVQVFDSLFEDFDGIPKDLAKVEDKLVDILETATGSTGLIEWYVYDTHMGTVPLDWDGNFVNNIDDLYNLILKELND